MQGTGLLHSATRTEQGRLEWKSCFRILSQLLPYSVPIILKIRVYISHHNKMCMIKVTGTDRPMVHQTQHPASPAASISDRVYLLQLHSSSTHSSQESVQPKAIVRPFCSLAIHGLEYLTPFIFFVPNKIQWEKILQLNSSGYLELFLFWFSHSTQWNLKSFSLISTTL